MIKTIDEKTGFSKPMQNLLNEIDKRDYEDILGLKANITEEDYYYFLEVLPPLYSKQTGFLLLEAQTHNNEGNAIRLWFYGTSKNGFHVEVVNEIHHLSKEVIASV